MSTVKSVAQRIYSEVGVSRAASFRIAKRLNELAKSVGWATPVGDGAFGSFFAKIRRGRKVRRKAAGKALTRRG